MRQVMPILRHPSTRNLPRWPRMCAVYDRAFHEMHGPVVKTYLRSLVSKRLR